MAEQPDSDIIFQLRAESESFKLKLAELEKALKSTEKKTETAASKMSESFKSFKDLAKDAGPSVAGALTAAGAAAVALGAGLVSLAAGAEKGAARALKALKDDADNALFAFQLVADGSGVVKVALAPLTAALDRLKAFVSENNVQLQSLVLDGMDALISGARTAQPLIVFLARSLVGAKGSVKLLGESLALTANALLVAGEAIRSGVVKALSLAVDGISVVATNAAALAESVGLDGLAGKLESAKSSLQGFVAAQDAAATDALKLSIGAMDAQLDTLSATVAKTGDEMDAFGEFVDREITGALDSAAKASAKARVEIKDLSAEIKRGRPKKGGAGAGTVVDELIEEQLHLITLQRQIVDAQATGNVEAERQLTLSLAIKQAELERQKSKGTQLDLAKEQLSIAQAQLAADQKSKEIAAAALAAQQEARAAQLEAERERQEAIDKIRQDAHEREMERIAQAGEIFRESVSSLDAGPALTALTQIGGGVDSLIAKYDALRQSGVAAGDALGQAAAGTTGLVGAAVAQQIKDTRKAAAIQGAFAAAQAILYYASGNVPAGIGATAASVAHFAVAGSAGKGGKGGGGAGGSTASGPQTPQRVQVDADAAARKSAQYIADALSRDTGARSVQISFNLAGAVLLEESPAIQRRLTQAMQQELDRQGVRLSR